MVDTFVTHTADDFAQAFANELPVGTAWSRDADSGTIQFITALAQVWGDISAKMTELMFVESDPRETNLMLSDWLDNYGLPDPCLNFTQTPAQQQAALMFRILLQGGASRQFFITLAASLGYLITIEEENPFRMGIAKWGQTPFYDTAVIYQWRVQVHTPAAYYFHFGRAQWGQTPFLSFVRAQDLECILRRFKPAHTILVFDYIADSIS